MASDGFHPPDFIFVIECDTIGLIGSIGFQKGSHSQDTLSRAVDIGKNQHDEIFLADSARGVLFLSRLCLFVFHERVCRKNSWVGGDRLRCRHADVGGIDSRCRPDALLLVNVRTSRITHGIFRELHLQMRYHALIFFRLFVRFHDDHFFDVKMSVVRPRNHCRIVMTGLLTDQYSSTWHSFSLLFPKCQLLKFSAELGVMV